MKMQAIDGVGKCHHVIVMIFLVANFFFLVDCFEINLEF
jgi:hypothetical protein